VSAWNGLLASFYGGIVEELLLRLFLMTLLLWLVARLRGSAPPPAAFWAAIITAALLFGAAHLPAAAHIWGLDASVVARTLLLNGIGGLVFGWLYWKRGIEMAMLAHFATDVVLHVVAPLLSPLLPPLLPAQIQHARNYCLRHGLPAPVVIEEDVGTFPRLSRDARPFALLAPRSLVAGGLSRLQLDHVSLPAELTSPVVARASAGGSSANAYLQLLQKILKEPDRSVLYNPGITLRQMRYRMARLGVVAGGDANGDGV